MYEEEDNDNYKCLPVSFLSSTELITVMVPYLKCLLSMQKQKQGPPLHSTLMHPAIQKHVSVMMGALPVADKEEAESDKPHVLIGRHRQRILKGIPPSKTSNEQKHRSQHQHKSISGINAANDSNVWPLDDDLEEYSD
jgi:hypothetical protein